MSERRQTLLLLAVAILLPGLFLAKGLRVDDAVFLGIADRLPFTLFGAEGGPVYFNGELFPNLSPYESTHPPLIPYLLKLLSPFVSNEGYPVAYHLAFLLFPLLCAWWMWDMTRTLGGTRAGVLLLWAAPAFLVNATSLMTDVAFITFWLGALASTLRYERDGKAADGIAAGVCVLAAMGCAYQGMVLPFLIAYFAYRRGEYRAVLPALLAMVVYLGVLYLIYLQSGFFPILAHTVDLNIGGLLEMGSVGENRYHKLAAALIQLGFGLWPALPLLWHKLGKQRAGYILWASSITTVLWFEGMGGKPWMSSYQGLYLVGLRLFFFIGLYWTIGLATMLRLPGKSEKRGEALVQVMLLSFFCVVGYNLVLMPYVNARYILPALPAALLCVAEIGRTRTLVPSLAAGLLMALLLCWVDAARARSDYQLFERVQQRVEQPNRVWYRDDHGLGRYFAGWGARYLRHEDSPEPGDYLVLSESQISQELRQQLIRVDAIRYKAPFGLELGPGGGAGFYSSHDGLLPINAVPVKDTYLYQVTDPPKAKP